MQRLKSSQFQIGLGILAGLLMVILALSGNPKNMALCTACFIRDTAGAMKFHSNEVTQYFRPEVVGLIVGSFLMAHANKEFRPSSSRNVMVQFLLGNVLMIGALIFLGCTLRLFLRLASGELAALIGLVGLILGVWTGVFCVKRGYRLSEKRPTDKLEGSILPYLIILAFVSYLLFPQFFATSSKGPGSMHASVWISLIVSLLFGAIAYQTRLCFTGSIRDAILIKDFSRLMPILSVFVIMLIYNVVVGDFAIISAGPIAHNQTFWNVLSMFVVGFAGVLAGGCPVRQIIMAGSGSTDAAVNVIGMFTGSALAHNFALASSPTTAETAGGPGLNGKIALFICLAILIIIAQYGIRANEPETKNS